jgi:hypothetical protein
MLQAKRSVMFRDLIIFLVKLAIDGLKDLALMNLAIGAAILDVLAGGGKRPRLFYSVLRLSERFDLWLNLNGAMEKMESGEAGDDGLFGASVAGSDSLLGQIEQLVRGGDVPRGTTPPTDGSSEARAGADSDEPNRAKPGRGKPGP